MGYSTDFSGKFNLDKPLKSEHFSYLRKFNDTRRMKRDANIASSLQDPVRIMAGLPVGEEGEFFVGGKGFAGQDEDDSVVDHNSPPKTQPGLWCQWTVNDHANAIVWDGGEKFYHYVEWLQYIIEKFIKPWGYVLNGRVNWEGEDKGDTGVITVVDNVVKAQTRREQLEEGNSSVSTNMKISTDGGKTWVDVDQLRVAVGVDRDDELDEDEGDEAELHFNFTEEGLIIDTWVDGVCVGTSSELYLEIGDRLVDGE